MHPILSVTILGIYFVNIFDARAHTYRHKMHLSQFKNFDKDIISFETKLKKHIYISLH